MSKQFLWLTAALVFFFISTLSTAFAADKVVLLGQASGLSCFVKTKGSQLLNSKGKVLNFSKELKKYNKKVVAIKKSITQLNKQIKALSKKKTEKAKSQLAKAKNSLAKKKAELAKFTALIVAIKTCKADKTTIAEEPVCGDGIIQPGEFCDGNCPTSCAQSGCSLKTLQGSAASCNAECVDAGTQSACVNGDGCCASGCNSTNDSDCKSACGNNVLESGESCDGSALGGATCTSLGFSGGTISCASGACQLNTSACLACPAGQTKCGASCVDLSSNSSNCGACGTACTGVNVCANGFCTAPCPVGMIKCGSSCINPNSDSNNCGGCGNTCAGGLQCSSGFCTIACASGQTKCGNSCVNLNSDAANCGACGTTCVAGQQCSNGTCGCPAGTALCGNSCVNLATSHDNCGSCGHTCGAFESCTNGTCQLAACSPGLANCDNDNSNGCETSLTTPAHCGSCPNVCNSTNGTASCTNQSCGISCNAGFANCNSSAGDGCEINTSTSPTNCGACGNNCSRPNASTSCILSACRLGACNNGFCNLDGNAANGCEKALNTNPACSSATFVGNLPGDFGGMTPIAFSGTGEAYFSLNVIETNTSELGVDLIPHDLLAKIVLLNPAGVDYDLEVTCSNCAGTTYSSALGAGATDVVNVKKADSTFSDQSYALFIHVKLFGVNTCAQWNVQIFGNTTDGAVTVNSCE